MLNLEQIPPVFIELTYVTSLFSCWLEWNQVVMSLEHVCKLYHVEEAHQEFFPQMYQKILQ
jgi:hypothetical protein